MLQATCILVFLSNIYIYIYIHIVHNVQYICIAQILIILPENTLLLDFKYTLN